MFKEHFVMSLTISGVYSNSESVAGRLGLFKYVCLFLTMVDINIYMSTSKNLVDIWELYSNQVLNEKAPAAKAAKFGKKPGPGAKELNSKQATEIANKETTGPGEAEGVTTDIVDIK